MCGDIKQAGKVNATAAATENDNTAAPDSAADPSIYDSLDDDDDDDDNDDDDDELTYGVVSDDGLGSIQDGLHRVQFTATVHRDRVQCSVLSFVRQPQLLAVRMRVFVRVYVRACMRVCLFLCMCLWVYASLYVYVSNTVHVATWTQPAPLLTFSWCCYHGPSLQPCSRFITGKVTFVPYHLHMRVTYT